MNNIKTGEGEERFMELVLQAIETHPLGNDFNNLFIGYECTSFEGLKNLFNAATLRAAKRISARSKDRVSRTPDKWRKTPFVPCSFHSHNGQRCSHRTISVVNLKTSPVQPLIRPIKSHPENKSASMQVAATVTTIVTWNTWSKLHFKESKKWLQTSNETTRMHQTLPLQ